MILYKLLTVTAIYTSKSSPLNTVKSDYRLRGSIPRMGYSGSRGCTSQAKVYASKLTGAWVRVYGVQRRPTHPRGFESHTTVLGNIAA